MVERFKNLEETFKEGQEWAEEICNYFDETNKAQMKSLLNLINLAYNLGREEAKEPNCVQIAPNWNSTAYKEYLDYCDKIFNYVESSEYFKYREYVLSHANYEDIEFAMKHNVSPEDYVKSLLSQH